MQKSDSFLVIQAAECDIKTIKELAYRIWPSTFKDILSLEQIAYMLDMMYSEESLSKQMSKFRHRFFFSKKKKQLLVLYRLNLIIKVQKKPKSTKYMFCRKSRDWVWGRN